MRKIFIFTVILTLLLGGLTAQLQAAVASGAGHISVSRTIVVKDGYVVISDRIEGANEIVYGLPNWCYDEVYYIDAKTADGMKAAIELEAEEEVLVLHVKGGATPINVTIALARVLTTTMPYVKGKLPSYPIALGQEFNTSLTVVLPSGAKFKDSNLNELKMVSNETKIVLATPAVKAPSQEEYTDLMLRFKANFNLLHMVKLERIIVVEPSAIHVKDYLVLENLKDKMRGRLTLPIFENAENFKVYDTIGHLKYTVSEEEGTITVTLRHNIRQGEKTSFTVEYELPWSTVAEEESFKVMPLGPYMLPADTVILRVVLGEGVEAPAIPAEFKVETNGGTAQACLTLKKAIPDFVESYEFTFKCNAALPMVKRWAPVAVIVVAVAAVAVFWGRFREKVVKERKVAKREERRPRPPEELGELLSKAIDGLDNLQRLEDALVRGRIRRRAYNVQKPGLESALRERLGRIEEVLRKSEEYEISAEEVEEIRRITAAIEKLHRRTVDLAEKFRRREVARGEYEAAFRELREEMAVVRLQVEELLRRLRS
ncbi:MAG: hypothetical protein J7L98_06025 [Candidatus Verstraetearchaeota archaeon]|nr:hypothetical protein [Candidatus Verstraetearchaeota archaeon]